ncbi:MAG: molybdenum cofactor biosynthesis protein MoaE [Pseudomonadota bacterium]|nr:molybdenum cofactor biosynthesis protein MoaE [Pseudomonadota bacterium]
MLYVDVRTAAFDHAELTQRLPVDHAVGAVANFIGYVRNHGDAAHVTGLSLEHYPNMTEQILTQHCQHALQRWSLSGVVLIHRVGTLLLGEPIVGVAVASAHRQAAFDAVQYLMDFLKHDAPFWKKEILPTGEQVWVEQKQTDQAALQRWHNP